MRWVVGCRCNLEGRLTFRHVLIVILDLYHEGRVSDWPGTLPRCGIGSGVEKSNHKKRN